MTSPTKTPRPRRYTLEPVSFEAILATTPKGVIGCTDGRLPWARIPTDMAHFKALTENHVVIVGGKTPLPPKMEGRRVIVLSKTATKETHPWANYIARHVQDIFGHLYSLFAAPNCYWAKDVVYVIGGAQVFEELYSLINRTHVTYVNFAPDPEDPQYVSLGPKMKAVLEADPFRGQHEFHYHHPKDSQRTAYTIIPHNPVPVCVSL